jgi:hypothetical protein
LLLLHNVIVQPAVFFRRSAIEQQFVDEEFDYAMDRELWLRLGRRFTFARLGKVVGIDRHHLARKTSARPDLVQADRERLIERYGSGRIVASDPRLKPMTFAFRVLGLRLVSQATATPAYPYPKARGRDLVKRQLAARTP